MMCLLVGRKQAFVMVNRKLAASRPTMLTASKLLSHKISICGQCGEDSGGTTSFRIRADASIVVGQLINACAATVVA